MPPPILEYGRESVPERIAYERHDGGLVIRIFRPNRRIMVAVGSMVMAGILMVLLALEFRQIYRGGLLFLLVGIVAGTLVACLAGVVMWLINKRMDEPIVIELTREALILRNLGDDVQEAPREKVLERPHIYAVKHVSHSGMLVVRSRAREMFECRISGDARTSQWVVEMLRTEMGLQETEPVT